MHTSILSSQKLGSEDNNPGKRDEELNTKLHDACKEGDLDKVIECEKNGADDWNNALWNAASEGHLHIFKKCEQMGADDWSTALASAACKLHVHIVQYIVDNGHYTPIVHWSNSPKHGDLNEWNVKLYDACKEGDLDKVMECEINGANDWNYALWNAARAGHFHIFKKYAMFGTCWDLILSGAAHGGHVPIIQYCVDQGYGVH